MGQQTQDCVSKKHLYINKLGDLTQPVTPPYGAPEIAFKLLILRGYPLGYPQSESQG